jgi:hypothetical protein
VPLGQPNTNIVSPQVVPADGSTLKRGQLVKRRRGSEVVKVGKQLAETFSSQEYFLPQVFREKSANWPYMCLISQAQCERLRTFPRPFLSLPPLYSTKTVSKDILSTDDL